MSHLQGAKPSATHAVVDCIITSFLIIEKFMESMENQYVDFSTCRQIVNICKISVKSFYTLFTLQNGGGLFIAIV